MNDDEMTGGGARDDDFWGGTPDWSDAPQRPRRDKRSGDVTGAIKNLWASAMGAGADATREHGVIDATKPLPADAPVGPNMFDDLDDEVFDFDRTDTRTDRTFPESDPLPTGELPVVDVFDEDTLAAVAPASMSEQASRRRGSGGLDPLLVRVGALAVATTLLIPLAIGLSSGSGDDDTIASATTEATLTEPTLATAPPVTESPATTTPAGLDPASLPPAVPVNVDRDDAAASETTDSGDVDDAGTEPAASASDESDTSASSTDTMESAAAESNQAADTSSVADSDIADSDGVNEAANGGDDAERVSSCDVDYTVVVGDFWLRLADAADVSLADLLAENGASVNTPLYPGMSICLPAGATTPEPPADQPATTDAPTTTAPPTTDAPTTTAPPSTDAPATTAPPTTDAPTTTEPTTTEPPSTVVSNTDASPEEVQQIIRDVWPDELEDRALEIAFRESRYVPTAKNYCCYGLFQIYWSVHRSWLADIGITDDQQLYDPATNARAAYALYQRAGGWGPWSQTNY